MSLADLYELRAALPSDAEYLHNSWIRSWERSDFVRYLGPHIVGDYSALVILPLLDAFTPLVACSKESPSFILGWGIASADTLHYLCVRPRYQKQGIATALRGALGGLTYFSHPAPDTPSLARGLIYRPGRMFEGIANEDRVRHYRSSANHPRPVGQDRNLHDLPAAGVGVHVG